MSEQKHPHTTLHRIDEESALPAWAARADLVRFFHETMKPFEDLPEDVDRALTYGFSTRPGEGGFLVLAEREGELAGALLMLRTGMGGYVPAHILLFVTVDPELRGQGIGGELVQFACREAGTPVKLHVEYDNPAKRLYERLGFVSKYAEMRYEG